MSYYIVIILWMQTVQMKKGHVIRLVRLLEEHVQAVGSRDSIDTKGKDIKKGEQSKQEASKEMESKPSTSELPAGKRWHYFAR